MSFSQVFPGTDVRSVASNRASLPDLALDENPKNWPTMAKTHNIDTCQSGAQLQEQRTQRDFQYPLEYSGQGQILYLRVSAFQA